MGRRSQMLFDVEDARTVAKKIVPQLLFDYVDGGTDDEITMRANREAFASVSFRPHPAIFPEHPNLSKTVLGQKLDIPVICAPCGGVRLMHRDGDRASFRATSRAGSAFILGTAAGTKLEDVADAANGNLWFQLYFARGRDVAMDLVQRVQKAGFGALFVTIDSDVFSAKNQRRLYKHRSAFPLQKSVRNVIHFMPQLVTHPRWTSGFVLDGAPTDFASVSEEASTSEIKSRKSHDSRVPPQWSDIDWIRKEWAGPLVVKGILSAEDAKKAIDRGADAIVVSNHGGRQLDGAPATLRVLGGIVEAVGDQTEILLDSGVRKGSDVVKALALGANAVVVGRPYLYGLGADGEDGVYRVLEIFKNEISRTLRHLGVDDINKLDPSAIDTSRL